MKNDLISVIIPAYNAQEFIQKCIESVLNQSYKNLDIIVIDDGSSDNTFDLSSRYKGVRVYHKENGGLCSARNFGVKHAKGSYVTLLDSDDYYEPDFISNLYKYHSGKDDEIVMCDFLKNGVKESQNCSFLELNSCEDIFDLYLHGGIYNRTVNKIYPIQMIKSVLFPEGRDMLEDAFFTSHILEKCNHIVRLPYAGYNYIRHDGTYTRKKLSLKQLNSMHANILEKDIVLSAHISQKEYGYLSIKIVEHISNCLNALTDLLVYDIYDKILLLLSFLKTIDLNDKKVLKFVNLLSSAKNPKELFKHFGKYSLFVGSLETKYLFLRNAIRKSFKKNR